MSKRSSLTAIWVCFFCVFAFESMAQTGPEVYLFRPSSSPGSLDADRYEVKERSGESTGRSKSRSSSTAKANKPTTTAAPAIAESKEKATAEPVILPKEPAVAVDRSGDTDSASSRKRSWLEVDPRFNYVEATVAPGYLYVNSESASWFRNYYSSAPVVRLGTRVWLNPAWGFGASYMHSFAGDITGQPSGDAKIEADHRQYDVDALFRRFAGNSRKASSLIAGLNYNEYQMIVPATSTDRIRIKTKGIGLVLGVRVPKTSKKAYSARTVLRPDTKVLEGGTASTYNSGRLESATSWSIEVKSESVLDRKNVFFWSLSHSVDRILYKGSAAATDPVTGTTLSGISVTSGRSMLNVGFTWGD